GTVQSNGSNTHLVCVPGPGNALWPASTPFASSWNYNSATGMVTATLTIPVLADMAGLLSNATGEVAPGVASGPAWTPVSASHNVKAEFGGVNPNYTLPTTPPMTTITISPEDARVTYAGSTYAVTSSTTTYSANVVLAARVQDITAVPSD